MNQTQKIALKNATLDNFMAMANEKGIETTKMATGFVFKENGVYVEVRVIVKKDTFDLEDSVMEYTEKVEKAIATQKSKMLKLQKLADKKAKAKNKS